MQLQAGCAHFDDDMAFLPDYGPADGRAAYLCDANAFGAWALGPLSLLERDGLTFPQLIEPRALARRVVEKVLGPVIRENEPEAFVADEPLNLSVHRC